MIFHWYSKNGTKVLTMLRRSLCLVSLNPPLSINKHHALYTQIEAVECTIPKMRIIQFGCSLCRTIVTYTKDIKPPRIINYTVSLLKKDKMKINILFIVMLVQFFENCLSLPVDNSYMQGLEKFCDSRLALELSILCKRKYNEVKEIIQRRQKRGVVEECCLTTCTRKYLKDYYCGLTEPKLKSTMETSITTSARKKNKPPQKINLISYFFNLVWSVGEEIGMISVPSDHKH